MNAHDDRRFPDGIPAELGPRGRLLRGGLVLLCVLLAAGAGTHYARWRSQRSEVLGVLRRAGLDVRAEETLREVARERTPHHARLAVSQALVNDILASKAGPRDAGAGRDREKPGLSRPGLSRPGRERLARLAEARELARQALAEQPNSWRAATLLGASIYLERSLTTDPRLYTAYADWERPLLAAMARTESRLEPRRLLAAAYLECWSALSEEKRAFAREVLRDVFRRDPSALRQLAPSWLEAATDQEEAFGLIPEQPGAWQSLGQVYARRRDWDSYCRAHAHRLDALEGRLRSDLEEAAERLRLGDLATARQMCLAAVAGAPPSRRFVPHVARALELYPPGLHAMRSAGALEEWVRWALRLDTVGIEALPPRVLNRLTDAFAGLEPAEAAHAALVGNDLYRMRQAEQRTDSRSKPAWTPFLVAKARRFLDRDLEEAKRALDEVAKASHSEMPYWLARQELARAGGDRAALAEATERVSALRRREWTSLDWRLLRDGAMLRLLPAAPAPGLVLELVPAAPTGAAVEVQWDGQLVAIQPVRRGQEIELPVTVEPRPHLLEIRVLANESVAPGPVRVRGSRSSGGKDGNEAVK